MTDRISARQLMLIIALSRTSVMAVFLPVVSAANALHDAWLASVVAAVAGTVLGLLSATLAARFPRKSLGASAKITLGTVAGFVVAAVFALFYLVVALAELRHFGILFETFEFSRTPGWALSLSIWAVAVYGVHLGADSLGRSAETLFTVVGLVIVFSLILAGVARVADTGYLRPMLARGWKPVLQATVNPIFWFATSGGVVLALGKFCEHSRLRRAVAYGLVISGTLLTVMAATATIVLGPYGARDQVSPLMTVAHTVFLRGVFERLDILLMSIWVIAVTFDVTLLFMVAVVILADAVSVSPNLVLWALAIPGGVILTNRSTTLFDFRTAFGAVPTGTATVVVFVGFVGLVLVSAILRGRGGDDQGA